MNVNQSDYELYQRRVSVAVRSHIQWHGLTAENLAAQCSMSKSTLYAKLGESRNWTLQDLLLLSRAGVHIPPFTADAYRRQGIQTRPKNPVEVVR